jgi:hypothetical protein
VKWWAVAGGAVTGLILSEELPRMMSVYTLVGGVLWLSWFCARLDAISIEPELKRQPPSKGAQAATWIGVSGITYCLLGLDALAYDLLRLAVFVFLTRREL